VVILYLKKPSCIAGKDKTVVLWSIEDHVTSAATDSKSGGSIIKQNSKSGEGNDKNADSPSVGPRGIYSGHDDTVEDVAFCPSRYVVYTTK
jgi:histone-binding protein RBBP4